MIRFILFCVLLSQVKAQSGSIPDWIIDLIVDLIPPLACLGGDNTPLKCDPGDVLRSTTVRSVNASLESVLWNDAISDKKVALGLSVLNNKDLYNPKWYSHEGEIHTIPPYELSTGRTVLLLFTKGEYNNGVEGILTYDIDETDYKLAIMYHISEDDDMSFNVKIYPTSYSTDENLYNHMLDSAGPWIPQSDWSEFQEREEYGIIMEATMSPRVRGSRMIVRVDTRGYDTSLGPNIALSCEYRDQSGYDDYYCKKECVVPLGECFTEVECETVDDCSQDDVCIQGC